MSFNLKMFFSPSELATYSFAAAALGGRILGNGMTDDLLWVAIATLITPNHPFCGKIVENIAPDGDFVPLYIAREDKNIHGWNLLTTELKKIKMYYI